LSVSVFPYIPIHFQFCFFHESDPVSAKNIKTKMGEKFFRLFRPFSSLATSTTTLPSGEASQSDPDASMLHMSAGDDFVRGLLLGLARNVPWL